MNTEKFKKAILAIVHYYQRVEDYFTKGSFGVKFYPILMYPCFRYGHSAILKLLAVLSIFLGLDFFFAELIAILFSHDSLSSYTLYTPFALSLPMNSVIEAHTFTFSPLYYLISLSFLLQGYLFWLIYLFAILPLTQKGKLIAGIFAIAFSTGMAMAHSAQGGQFTSGGLQNLGVSITLLIGNLLMIITGLTLNAPALRSFKQTSLIGGLLGVLAIGITLFQPTEYLPFLERISLYTILLWEMVVGFAVLKQIK